MKKILKKYCLKYLLVFILILGACVPVAVVSYRVIRAQVIETSQLHLEEGTGQLNRFLEQMTAIVRSAEQDPYVKQMSRVYGELDADSYVNLSHAMEAFRDLGAVYTLSPYFFTLFQNNDIFLSSDQCSGRFSRDYYGTLLTIWEDGKMWSEQQLRTEMFDHAGARFFCVPDKIQFYIGENKREIDHPILCMIRGNSNQWLELSNVMVFVLDPDDVAEQISTEEIRENGIIRIRDMEGRELLSWGTAADLTAEETVPSGNTEGKSYQILSSEANELGWKIQIGIASEQIMQRVQEIIWLIGWYFALGLLVILSIVLVLMYRQFHSVKRLWMLLPSDSVQLGGRTDEYGVLSSVFREIREHADQYRDQIGRMEEKNRGILLENYIVHGIFPEEDREKLRDILKDLPEFYCMALVQMKEDESKHQMVQMFFTKVLKEKNVRTVLQLHTDIQEELFLFEMLPSGEATAEGIRKWMDEGSRILLTEQGIVIHAGISTIGTKMENLPVCYQQAKHILTAYHTAGGQEEQCIVEAYHCGWRETQDQFTGMEFLQKLSNYLSCGEREMAARQISGLLEICRKNPLAFEMQKAQIFYSVRNVLYYVREQSGLKNPEGGLLPEYREEDSAGEMIGRLLEAADQLMDQIDEKKKSKNTQLKTRIIRYVEEHFSDAELSVRKVCGDIGISEKYLTQYVKEQTGETFAVYVERVRVEKAAEYLKNTDWTNEVIAKKCGFAVANTFYRVFHKRMGVSPGVYRKEKL